MTNIVAVGDSLTFGFGASPDQSYPAQLSRLLDSKITNKGVNGDTVGGLQTRLADDVLSLKPDVVFITILGNDILRRNPIETSMQKLDAVFEQLTQNGVFVVYLGLKPPLVKKQWYEQSKEVAKRRGVLWVDRAMRKMWGGKLMHDRIHPNADGYKIMAERVFQRLQEVKAL